MSKEKQKPVRNKMHSRNKNKERYDLNALLNINPALRDYLKPNHKGEDSIDFTNPIAVKVLNQTILHHYYGIENWNFSDENLCPTIPSRADYIHHMADVLMASNFGNLPEGNKITCLDIGTGATCIYPIIGVTEYNWNFIATDIDDTSINNAQVIIKENDALTGKIECRLQGEVKDVIYGILNKEENVDLTICNPPFYSSVEDAEKGTQKKNALYSPTEIRPEIIYKGGETAFLQNYVKESKNFGSNCYWFSALVTKQSNQTGMVEFLTEIGATETKTISIGLGNKSSQIIAWSFLSKEEQKIWKETKWKTK